LATLRTVHVVMAHTSCIDVTVKSSQLYSNNLLRVILLVDLLYGWLHDSCWNIGVSVFSRYFLCEFVGCI